MSSRLLTFVLNLLVVRRLPPEVYGVAVIQFHLITTTILTFSREGVRRACLRGVKLGLGENEAAKTKNKQEQGEIDLKSIVPLSWFCLPQGLAWSTLICTLVLAFPGARDDEAYKYGVLLHGVAAFIEILSEPAYILSTCLLVFKLQVTVETLANVAKCLATLLLLRPSLGIPPLLAFGFAAVFYSGTLFVGYWSYFIYKGMSRSMISLQLVTLARIRDIESTMLSAYFSFTFQAIEKHFLGEGEKFAMAAFQPPYDQGVYGLVNNLGSIVVRTAFQPFEQAVFTAFSMSSSNKDKPSFLQDQANLLSLLLKLVLLFAGICVAFGPSYSFTLLWFSYGRKWALTEAPRILNVYCFYISAMALNGVTEAFMHATADEKALKQINVSLIVFSILHSITSIVLVNKLGTYGLVIAACISMLIRVGYCCTYMLKYFSSVRYSFRSISPSPFSIIAGATCAVLVHVSERIHIPSHTAVDLKKVSTHFAFGCCIGLSLLYLLYKKEREMVTSLLRLRGKSKGKEQ